MLRKEIQKLCPKVPPTIKLYVPPTLAADPDNADGMTQDFPALEVFKACSFSNGFELIYVALAPDRLDKNLMLGGLNKGNRIGYKSWITVKDHTIP